MNALNRILNFSIFFFVGLTVFGQNENSTKSYTGTILDRESNIVLPYATIGLFDSESNLLASGLSDEDGIFNIPSAQVASTVKVSFVGYKSFVKEISLATNNLGKLFLEPESQLLKETTITANKVNNEIDKNSYLVTENMRRQASNAQELLDQVHGVRLDKISNTIKVGTESQVLLLVDNIQQSAEYIRNLAPDRITHIEVSTEPTGRYLSQGYGAIINFILKKDYSGYDINFRNRSSLSLAHYNGTDWLMNEQPGIGFTYTKNKINIFANYSYSRQKTNTAILKNQTYTDLFAMESEITNRRNPNNKYSYQSNYLSGGINYQFNTNHSLSIQMDYTYQKINEQNNFTYKVVNFKNNADYTTTNNNQNLTKDNNYVGTVFYKGKIGDKLKLYSDFTFNHYTDNINNSVSQGADFYQQNLYKEQKDYTMFNLEGEYSFNPKFTLNVGYVNIWKKYESKNIQDITFLNYTERRNQLFAYLQYKATEMLTVKFGASLEYININSDDKTNFWNLQPYFQLNYKMNKHANLNIAYLTNSHYPTLYQLSPIATAIDSVMMQSGNPNLRSAVRHTISATLTLWDRLTIRPMAKFTPKRISEIYTHENDNYYSTFVNIDVQQYVLQAIYDQPINKYFRWSNMLAYYHDRANHEGIKSSHNGWIINSELGYFNLKWNLGAQLSYSRGIDKGILLQGYQMVSLDYWMISAQKQFWNKRASLTVSYFPPFNWGLRERLDKKINTPFYSENLSQSLAPYRNMFVVSFSLRFKGGKPRQTDKESSTEYEGRNQRAVGL